MNLWIVTIGSSDVQLDSDKVNRDKERTEKQRSDKVWQYWYEDEIRAKCHDITPEPKKIYKDNDEPYRIPPRVLGRVYEESDSEKKAEILSYLTFPLLDNFISELKKLSESPDAIVVLLTDQSVIFKDLNARRKLKCAYWQDTCELKSILECYFKNNTKFPKAAQIWIELEPKSDSEELKGFDDWNSVLNLVSNQFRDLKVDGQSINLESIKIVYVSHQAGTPAISSAVQFASLAQFGDRVKFLVSSEQDKTLTDIVKSSAYLQGIEIQQVNKLLDWHDYAGAQEVLKRQIKEVDEQKDNPKHTDEQRKRDEKIRHIAYLLEVATQWNFAKFEDFADKLKEHPNQAFATEVSERRENWWWTAYETAYLGVVRLKQGNTVEAMFHSFRAVEGLIYKWVNKYHSCKLDTSGKKIIVSLKEDGNPKKTYNAYGEGLYLFLDMCRTVRKNNDKDIWIFGNCVFDRRNRFFHQLEGLQDKNAVFVEWQSSDEKEDKSKVFDEQCWKARVINCLNFIAKDDWPDFFSSPEEASLMLQVHTELEKTIENL